MRRLLGLLVFFLVGCIQPTRPCADGFVQVGDGVCDLAPSETGADTDTGPVGPIGTRLLFTEGDFRGANVIGISIDTMPWWAVTSGFMPNLQAIASEGVQLEQHQSGAVWTPPSMISFALGASATDLGVEAFFPDTGAGNAVIPDTANTFSEVLAAAGYQTVLVTENGFFGDVSNTNQGFGVYRPAKTMSDGVEAFIEALGGLPAEVPYYAHYHVMGPHEPYIDPDQPERYFDCLDDLDPLPGGIDFREDLQVSNIVSLWPTWTTAEQDTVNAALACVYGGQLSWVDDVVFGETWRVLDRAGALDNTIAVLFSDHGEEFGEHDGSTGVPNYGHNQSSYPQVGHVFGAFWANDGMEAYVVDGPTDHGDVAPTVLTALGVPVPESMTGVPIGSMTSTRVLSRYKCGGPVGEEIPTVSYAAQRGDDVLRLREDGAWESFDVSSDPEELSPGSNIDPDLEQAIITLQGRAQHELWCGGR